MNLLPVWLRACLKKCVALFASKGAGTFLKTKLIKNNVLTKKEGVEKVMGIDRIDIYEGYPMSIRRLLFHRNEEQPTSRHYSDLF